MKVEFDVNLDQTHIFKFNMYQTYKSTQGMLSLVLPAIIFFRLYMNYESMGMDQILINLGLGILFLVYVPISLWLRAKKALKKNSVLASTLHFAFTEQSICVTQGEDKAEFKWENIYRMVSTKNLVLIYTNRVNAYVIPKLQMGMEYVKLAELAKSQLDKSRVRLR
uniref:YcxB family protein n=1 Tax=Agathobacter sp. TaxID=2021311 RepID=UPI004056D3F5